MKPLARARCRILLSGAVMFVLVSQALACGGLQESQSDLTARKDAGEGDSASDPVTSPADEGKPPVVLVDASVPVVGEACLSRPISDDCVAWEGSVLSPSWSNVLYDCEREVLGRTLCGYALLSTVDEQGCVLDVAVEPAAPEKLVKCIAAVAATRRWPCAQKGQQRFTFNCSLIR